MNRTTVLGIAAALGALTAAACFPGDAAQASPGNVPGAENSVVYKEPGVYACFPDLLQTSDGALYTEFSTRRNKGNNPHADMTGGTAVCVSRDGGRTWQRLAGGRADDPAIRRKDGGTARAVAPGWIEIPAERQDAYKEQGYVTTSVRPGVAAYLGGVTLVTRNPGAKDETRRPVPGTEQASLMNYGETLRTRAGVRMTPVYGSLKRPPVGWTTSYVARSGDDGATWQVLPIAAPITDSTGTKIAFNETALAELSDGKIVAMMRPDPESVGCLYQSVSADAGKTWSAPVRTPVRGFPAHLLPLKNGDLLCTYGYRRAPMGIRACVSHDGGATWDVAHEYILRDDGAGRGMDLGYPRTTQLNDGTLVTVYYMTAADGVTHVAATRWRVPAQSGAGEAQTRSTPGDGEAAPIVISRGAAAGTYQAFPDACRLRNGDIVAVFYAGYQHVSLPKRPDWPNGGRICLVRSHDEGHTWSEPEVIYDDADDNRDPHIAQMPDGTLRLTFFSLKARSDGAPGHEGAGIKILSSRDDAGKTWDPEARTLTAPADNWYCSAPVRVLPGGTWILGVYHFDASPDAVYGGVLRSTDQGRTWSAPIPIGKGQGIPLDAETDVIALNNGTLFAALRCGKPGANLYYATSADDGKTWTPAKDIGFAGHAPYLYRLKNGTLLLAHRLPHTALHLTRDEGKTWQGPFEIDSVDGAYPSVVELKDGSVLIVYYTEGKGSVVRARRFRILSAGIEALPL